MQHLDPAPTLPEGFRLAGPIYEGYETILTPDALAFITTLVRAHGKRLSGLLERRAARHLRHHRGERPCFLDATRIVRKESWTVAPLPKDLLDRRVEITGPVDRKMIINALNSGAQVFMADFEDSTAPTWANVVEGQIHLRDAVAGTIRYTHPTSGKRYELGSNPAVLMVRPRGLHLTERHLTLDGEPLPACLVDLGLFLYHNAHELLAKGSGPYFYLPKLESHLEARWWNDVFVTAQGLMGLDHGSIKATVLIETLPAVFEMDEILYELRAHAAGLNCGRWDYIFSTIKTLGYDPDFVLPDRDQVRMDQPFLRAYTQLLVKTCHRRGAFAIGGMAAQIPIRSDEAANRRALDKVRVDKLREVCDGHDGTWVAHPGLVPIAREVFDAHISGPNQLGVRRDDVSASADELTALPVGTRTEAGLRHNIRVGVQYLEAWLRGSGCVPLYDLMEDAATAEISRTQIWQWIRHGAALEDGRVVTTRLFEELLDDEMRGLALSIGLERMRQGRFEHAINLFHDLSTSPELVEFLTLPAYEQLVSTPTPAEE